MAKPTTRWFVGYLTREGKVIATPEAVVVINATEKDVTNSLEDLLAADEPPFGAYAAYVFPWKASDGPPSPKKFDTVMYARTPRFIVTAGHTAVIPEGAGISRPVRR
jgi:hypothetical protein